MISNQILQNTLDGLKNISRSDFCVADTEGKILAFTAQNSEISSSDILGFAASPADSQVVQENQFFKVYDENRLEYVLVVSGGSEDTYMIGQMAAFQIQNLLVAYKERFDKDNFIKKIADFYGLETEADYQDFLDTFCTNEFINHYNSVENPESDN